MTALQTEYSLWAREPENGLLADIFLEPMDLGAIDAAVASADIRGERYDVTDMAHLNS